MEKNGGRKASWAQPSLSRDFALLSAAIIFIMLLISAWVTWITYIKHSERILLELEKETDRIERTLESEIVSTGYLLTAIGHQISQEEPEKLQSVAQLLQYFTTGNPQYALWNWSDEHHRIVVSSRQGVLEEPVFIGDRDYVKSSEQDPWQIVIGAPVEGRVSGRWVVPVSVGVTQSTGKFIGSLTAAIDIDALTKRISELVKRDGISFAVISKEFVPLTAVADSEAFDVANLPIKQLHGLDLQANPKGTMSQAGLISGGAIYSYYLVSSKYPYIIVVAYDTKASDSAMRSLLWPRMSQILVVAGFLLSFLWIVRVRVIKPVVELSAITASVATGGRYHALQNAGPQEIEQLSSQISLVSDYIAERQLLEDELRSKIVLLHRRQQQLQIETRQRSVLLAGLLAEYKKALRSINANAQALKDQLHGPIEDKKYRGIAADIHQTGTTLELMLRKLIALSRVDATAIVTRDEPVRLATLLENACRFATEAVEGTAGFTLLPPEGAVGNAVIQLDSMHVQQALAYVLLYLMVQRPEETEIRVRGMKLPGAKARENIVLLLGKGNPETLTPDIVRQVLDSTEAEALTPEDDALTEQMHITLAQAMLAVQDIELGVLRSREAGVWAVILFPAGRVQESNTAA